MDAPAGPGGGRTERGEARLKPDVLVIGPMMEGVMAALDEAYKVHRLWQAPDRAALLRSN